MSVIDRIKEKAKTDLKHIVLAEGSEPRTVQASAKIVAEGLAKITLIGKPEEIQKVADRCVVFYEGRIVSIFEHRDVNEHNVMLYSTNAIETPGEERIS